MSDSFIVEKLKKSGLRSVWPNHIGNSSPPEATSLGVTFRSYLRGCRSTQPIVESTREAIVIRGMSAIGGKADMSRT